jgi:hypothetical protein
MHQHQAYWYQHTAACSGNSSAPQKTTCLKRLEHVSAAVGPLAGDAAAEHQLLPLVDLLTTHIMVFGRRGTVCLTAAQQQADRPCTLLTWMRLYMRLL